MKKIIFAVGALLIASMMFTSCGKKDEAPKEPVSQSQENTKADNNTQKSEGEATPETEDKKDNENTDNEQKSGGITNDKGEPVTSEDFENLVDTFNNTDDEEKKEEARKQIEAILKQAEANAQ